MNQQQLIDGLTLKANHTYERSLTKADIKATLDALDLTPFLAAISIAAPVCGLRPVRADWPNAKAALNHLNKICESIEVIDGGM